jgi:hypothetical protein
MRDNDRKRAPSHPWVDYLEGNNPNWPAESLEKDMQGVAKRMKAVAKDDTTPDTRLADAVLKLNPALVTTLMHQTMGAIHIARPAWSKTSAYAGGSPLFARLRHFDPKNRRAGLPEDVACLVTKLKAKQTCLVLANTSLFEPREIIIQAGGYGEHQFVSMTIDGKKTDIDHDHVRLKIPPNTQLEIDFEMRRYVNQPRLAFPWDR